MTPETRYQLKAALYGLVMGGLLGTCPITASIIVYDFPPVIEVAYAVAFVLGGVTGLLFALIVSPLVAGIRVPVVILVLSAGTLFGAIPLGLATKIPFFSLPGGIIGYWCSLFLLIYFARSTEWLREKNK